MPCYRYSSVFFMVLDFLVIRLFIQFGRIGCWYLNMRAGKVRMISLVSGYSFLFKTRHWRKDSIGFSAHNRISRHP